MDVKNVDISQLKPYYNNPRNNEKSIDDVAKSIKKFGWQQPIVVDKDMVIIVGHTRYLAAKKLKLKEVPVRVAKELKGGAIRELNIAKKVDNSLFREMISLGRYTVIPYEKKKDYVTSRMFETMTSNAITLFNKKEVKVDDLVLPELQYETPQEAVEIINGKYSEELLQEQHDVVRKLDFDKHIEQEAEAFRKMLL